jgi:hypothetical protein
MGDFRKYLKPPRTRKMDFDRISEKNFIWQPFDGEPFSVLPQGRTGFRSEPRPTQKKLHRAVCPDGKKKYFDRSGSKSFT